MVSGCWEPARMTFSPCLIRSSTAAGDVRFELGHPLVDRYLEFVAGRSRPNTLRAVAFDLKTFFVVVAKDPIEVVAADVFGLPLSFPPLTGHVGYAAWSAWC